MPPVKKLLMMSTLLMSPPFVVLSLCFCLVVVMSS